MASTSTSRVIRRKRRPVAPGFRYHPCATGTPSSEKEDMKKEVVRLSVDLSLSVAESMFLLCDDIRTLLWFCYKIWRCTVPQWGPVSERLLGVMYHVYSKDIRPKNAVFREGTNSLQFQMISTNWKDLCDGIKVLHRLVSVLRRKDWSYDDRLLSSAIAKFKLVLKSLEDKLRTARHVSESNGFARDMIESNISDLWGSLFDEDHAVIMWKSSLFGEDAREEPAKVMHTRALIDLFRPIAGHLSRAYPKTNLEHVEMHRLPLYSPYLRPQYSPYILGEDFAEQELKQEAVRLGVELSLHVAGSMFSLCDNIRSMLLFCDKLLRDISTDLRHDSPVLNSLIAVIHYVNSSYIKPKNGVYQQRGHSVQWNLIQTTLENFGAGIRDLHVLVSILRRGEGFLDGREFTSSTEEALNKLQETLMSAKDVSEANGFSRDALESNILDLWKPIFDKDGSLNAMRLAIFGDLFQPHLAVN